MVSATKSRATEKIEEHILQEDQQSRELLEKSIFPLTKETLRFVFDSLDKQMKHTEQIMVLAVDQSDEEKKRLHQTLVTVRRLLKDRLLREVMREIEQRRIEKNDIEKQQVQGSHSHQSLSRVKNIVEGCENLVLVLRKELETLDTIDTYINKNNVDGIKGLWAQFLESCRWEAGLLRQLQSSL
ncbi:MAG: hypothetical protein EPN86_06425 [Nanoarchaeota archaeon]|nr:MAG: hypothetical protein EPN86_06425 [Nanoarchaeota archaeon]